MTRDGAWQEFNRRLDKAGEVVGVEPMEREQLAAVEWYRSQVARECQREQTAATIYVALLRLDPDRASFSEAAVAAGQLREALEGK